MAEAPALIGTYLGMNVSVSDIDLENLEYFKHCGQHDYRLQQCVDCDLLRYPPTTACPWCTQPESRWVPVEAKGVVYSYSEVWHAIMPQFRDHLPYHLLLVELDTQRAVPTEHEAIRIWANLVEADGTLAKPETVRAAGVGTRVRIVYVDVGEGFAIPQFCVDESALQPAAPWRYAQE